MEADSDNAHVEETEGVGVLDGLAVAEAVAETSFVDDNVRVLVLTLEADRVNVTADFERDAVSVLEMRRVELTFTDSVLDDGCVLLGVPTV